MPEKVRLVALMVLAVSCDEHAPIEAPEGSLAGRPVPAHIAHALVEATEAYCRAEVGVCGPTEAWPCATDGREETLFVRVGDTPRPVRVRHCPTPVHPIGAERVSPLGVVVAIWTGAHSHVIPLPYVSGVVASTEAPGERLTLSRITCCIDIEIEEVRVVLASDGPPRFETVSERVEHIEGTSPEQMLGGSVAPPATAR